MIILIKLMIIHLLVLIIKNWPKCLSLLFHFHIIRLAVKVGLKYIPWSQMCNGMQSVAKDFSNSTIKANFPSLKIHRIWNPLISGQNLCLGKYCHWQSERLISEVVIMKVTLEYFLTKCYSSGVHNALYPGIFPKNNVGNCMVKY